MTRLLSEVYTLAAGLVRRGWVRGHYKIADCYCARGALIEATCDGMTWAQKLGQVDDDELCRPLAEYLGGDGRPRLVVSRWNDQTVARGEDVALAFEAVAAKLKEAGQ